MRKSTKCFTCSIVCLVLLALSLALLTPSFPNQGSLNFLRVMLIIIGIISFKFGEFYKDWEIITEDALLIERMQKTCEKSVTLINKMAKNLISIFNDANEDLNLTFYKEDEYLLNLRENIETVKDYSSEDDNFLYTACIMDALMSGAWKIESKTLKDKELLEFNSLLAIAIGFCCNGLNFNLDYIQNKVCSSFLSYLIYSYENGTCGQLNTLQTEAKLLKLLFEDLKLTPNSEETTN